MSRPHVCAAIANHDRPSRGLGGGPFGTPTTTLSIVTNSMTAIARIAIPTLPRLVAIAARANPRTFPRTCINPTIALAWPTCRSGTRSGT
jgi:hypothetical protein